MNIYPNHATGFTVSALFHGAILVSLLYGQMSMQYNPAAPESLSLNLAMFQPSQPSVTESLLPDKEVPAEPKPKSAPPAKKLIPAITKKPAATLPKPEILQPDITTEKPAEELIDTVKAAENSTTEKVSETQTQNSTPDGKTGTNATIAPVLDHGIIESLEATYMAALRNAIEAHKFYPRRARRMKREGKVVIDFTISRNGAIHSVHIAQTSGTKILDKAALDAVNKLGQFEPIPEQLPHANWKLKIPMEFTLL